MIFMYVGNYCTEIFYYIVSCNVALLKGWFRYPKSHTKQGQKQLFFTKLTINDQVTVFLKLFFIVLPRPTVYCFLPKVCLLLCYFYLNVTICYPFGFMYVMTFNTHLLVSAVSNVLNCLFILYRWVPYSFCKTLILF